MNKNRNSNSYFIYGKHAVKQAIQNSEREKIKLFLTPNTEKELVSNTKVPIEITDNKYLDKIIRTPNAVHQGVVLEVKPFPTICSSIVYLEFTNSFGL